MCDTSRRIELCMEFVTIGVPNVSGLSSNTFRSAIRQLSEYLRISSSPIDMLFESLTLDYAEDLFRSGVTGEYAPAAILKQRGHALLLDSILLDDARRFALDNH